MMELFVMPWHLLSILHFDAVRKSHWRHVFCKRFLMAVVHPCRLAVGTSVHESWLWWLVAARIYLENHQHRDGQDGVKQVFLLVNQQWSHHVVVYEKHDEER